MPASVGGGGGDAAAPHRRPKLPSVSQPVRQPAWSLAQAGEPGRTARLALSGHASPAPLARLPGQPTRQRHPCQTQRKSIAPCHRRDPATHPRPPRRRRLRGWARAAGNGRGAVGQGCRRWVARAQWRQTAAAAAADHLPMRQICKQIRSSVSGCERLPHSAAQLRPNMS